MAGSKFMTVKQVSAGGVAYREGKAGIEVVLICVGDDRWQLPKGIVEPDEDKEVAAIREVQEETGVEADLVAPIETIEYWYVGRRDGRRIRFHKFVHFYLLRYRSAGTPQQDREVILEVRWMDLAGAEQALAYENEKRVLRKARQMIQEQVSG